MIDEDRLERRVVAGEAALFGEGDSDGQKIAGERVLLNPEEAE